MDSLRQLLDVLSGPVGVVADGRWLYANTALERLLERELIGRQAIDVVVDDERSALAPWYRGAEGVHAARWVGGNGTSLAVDVVSRRISLDGAPAFVLQATDLSRAEDAARESERAAAEAALRDSEARYRLLFDSSPVPVCVFDADTLRYLAVNQNMVDLYGYSREEFLAMTVGDVKPPEDVAALVDSLAAASVGRRSHIGVRRHLRKDGSTLEIDITSHLMQIGDRRCSLAIGVDVTEQRKIEEQLRHAQKMEAIGQLAGGVAHDFNNLLAIILGTTSYMRETMESGAPFASELAEIEAAAERGARLTRQLLTFSRKEPRAPRELLLHSVVEDTMKMLRRVLGEDIELSTRLASAGQVIADPGQLEQVIMNLAINARDAMPAGGRLALETSAAVLDPSAASMLGVAPGPYALLSVTDTGCGMAEATRSHLFEPFFTTKEVGRGTGLGLATVFGIVRQSEGAITVESRLGHGSTFRIYLPRVDRAEAAPEPREPVVQQLRGTEGVLIVEDDPQLRTIILRRLRALGYRAFVACDGRSALDMMMDTSCEPVDLVVTDLVMPGMDGRTLAAELLLARPELKILFMSGYTEHRSIKTAPASPDDHFLSKPFSAADLSSAVRRALESP